jgi:hypothetical protein
VLSSLRARRVVVQPAVLRRPAAMLVRARRPLAARVARASSAIVHARV